jgi:CDP-diacylglycerol--serine O-phosphatidyltransferase
MKIKKNIPNAITCCNLFCGCLSIIKIFEGDLILGSYLIGLSILFDFFDGFFARLLKVSSSIGKDLDSLADMVTFGLAPALIMFKLIGASCVLQLNSYLVEINPIDHPVFLPQYLALIITIFSAIRLAKFNNDSRQFNSFIGLPTPANAIIICSLPLISEFQPNLILINSTIHSLNFLICFSLLSSYLLVAEIPMFALKFKNFKWRDNKLRFVFLIMSLLFILVFKFLAIPIIVIIYILLSIVNNIFLKKKE